MEDAKNNMKNLNEQEHTYTWTISDWLTYEESWMHSQMQTFVFEASFDTKWELSLRCITGELCYFWKLLQLPNRKIGLNAKLMVNLPLSTEIGESQTVQLERNLEPNSNLVDLCQQTTHYSDYHIGRKWCHHADPLGAVTFQIRLIITQLNRLPEKSMDEYFNQFHKMSRINLSAILNDSETSDLKIITSDDQELVAHKLILKAQCPVFASMFRSKFKEAVTGIIEIKDINSKTMNVLLRFFYTGELLPSWKDEDIIVEFVYAAGKYEMTQILEMLDDVLGTNYEDLVTHQTVLLLDLAQKLSLKVAEKTLLERIIQKIYEIKTTEELVKLFGFLEINEFCKMKCPTVSEFKNCLTLFDSVLGNVHDCEDVQFDLSLLVICKEISLSNVEVKLLEWLKNIVKRFNTANELFDLFQFGRVEKNQTTDRDELVRAEHS